MTFCQIVVYLNKYRKWGVFPLNDLAQIISSIGFPITLCLILMYYIREVIDKLDDTIQKNTLTIQKLLDDLDSKGLGNNGKE